MTDPVQPRPQPVVDLASFGANIVVVVGGLAFIVDGIATATHWTWAISCGAGLTGAAAFLAKYVPKLAAIGAAAQVTPLEDPRDHLGKPLTSSGGKHRAPEGDDVEAAAAEHHARLMGRDRPLEERRNQLVRLSSEWTDGWYERGGILPPEATAVRNDTGKAIKVVPRTDTQEIPRVTDEPVHRIPEHVVPGKRLGRHVRHDPRSLSYLVPETDTPVTAMWTRRVPVFDQGDVGSCTGNAAAGVLGTDPFYSTLPAGLVDDEGEAVKLYSAATALDDYTGTYPPDDTGSDGLSVAKACQKAGLISGYTHITSVAAAQTAIKSGPFIVGVNWYSSMDNPAADGLVTVGGYVRGGHEFECHGYDAQADRWWFTNSWGPSWGKDGTFCMSSASFARLLSEQGDATVFLPIAAPFPPAPTPTPPGPTPSPSGFPLAQVQPWLDHAYSFSHIEKNAKNAIKSWLNGGS